MVNELILACIAIVLFIGACKSFELSKSIKLTTTIFITVLFVIVYHTQIYKLIIQPQSQDWWRDWWIYFGVITVVLGAFVALVARKHDVGIVIFSFAIITAICTTDNFIAQHAMLVNKFVWNDERMVFVVAVMALAYLVHLARQE